MQKGDMGQQINGNFKGKDILSLDQFSAKDIATVLRVTEKMKAVAVQGKPSTLLAGTIVTLLFYEPSSRTFGSFGAAAKQLGGQTIDIVNPEVSSSVSKGETLEDTIKVFEAYSHAIVIRHKIVGAARKAADAAFFVPVINAGDGTGEHPTQALLDLFTIHEQFGHLDSLTGVMAGDLLNGRTIHSLIRGLSLFKKNTLYLLSPKQLRLSRADFAAFSEKGIKLIEIESPNDIPANTDFWYWTRVQKERFDTQEAYEKVKNICILTPELIQEKAEAKTIFMHPLPRVGEIDPKVDEDKRALYLRNEVRNGKYVRMALLALVLGKVE